MKLFISSLDAAHWISRKGLLVACVILSASEVLSGIFACAWNVAGYAGGGVDGRVRL